MKVLIINLTRLGDILQTTPLMAGLKDAHADCHISLLVNKAFVGICRMIPEIDKLYVLDMEEMYEWLTTEDRTIVENYHDFRTLPQVLRSEKFDQVYNLTHSGISLVLTAMIGCPDTRGTTFSNDGHRVVKSPWINYFFNLISSRGLNQFNLVDIYMRSGGIKSGSRKLSLKADRNAGRRAREFLQSEGVCEGDWLVGFQPGSSRKGRRWPTVNFARLAEALEKNWGAKIILLGVESEKGLGSRICEASGASPINAVGRTDLELLAGIVERCDLLVTNDTGTMHISSALGTPIIGLFLATARCYETGPYGEGHIILEPDIDCTPCNPLLECTNPVCIDRISVAHVLEAVRIMREGDALKAPDMGISWDGVRIMQSRFDDEGVLDFVPLLSKTARRDDILNRVYRSMWIRDLDGEAFTREPEILVEAHRIASWLDSKYRVSTGEGDVLNGTLSDFARLEGLARAGLSLCSQLEPRTDSVQRNIVEIKDLGRRLQRIDDEIYQMGLINKDMRPLTIMFEFDKENLEDATLTELVRGSKEFYAALVRRSNAMRFLSLETQAALGGRSHKGEAFHAARA